MCLHCRTPEKWLDTGQQGLPGQQWPMWMTCLWRTGVHRSLWLEAKSAQVQGSVMVAHSSGRGLRTRERPRRGVWLALLCASCAPKDTGPAD